MSDPQRDAPRQIVRLRAARSGTVGLGKMRLAPVATRVLECPVNGRHVIERRPVASLVVIDPHARAYDDESIFHHPLAGTASAVLETCLSIAQQIDTTLFNGVADDKHAGRLRLKASHRVAVADLAATDWLVFVSSIRPELLEKLPFRAGRPRLALWAHHDINQPAVASLTKPSVLRQISKFLFVSEWQRDRYCNHFSIDKAVTTVIGNPYCERALERIGKIEKRYDAPHLCYTSTPFRGLDVLADAFPIFASRFPGARLTVLSGMELYGDSDNSRFQRLFDKLVSMPQVECLKPAGKLKLYEYLREANVFSYPSTFAETFCIGALEACVLQNAVLLTRTGALPEIFPDAGFIAQAPGKPTPEAWAEFMIGSWERIVAEQYSGALTASAEAYRRSYAPSAVADRLRRALFG
jgi:glycosyltransferase involved in cell wall biosynthesis